MILNEKIHFLKQSFVDSSRRPFLIIALLLFFLPSSIHASNLLIALLFVEAVMKYFTSTIVTHNGRNTLVWAYLLLFLVYILSGINSANTAWYIFELEKKLSLLVLPLSFLAFNVNKVQQRQLLSIFAYSTVFWLFVCLILSLGKFVQTHDVSYLYMDKLAEWIGMLRVYFSLYIFFSLIILWHDFADNIGNRVLLLFSISLCVLGMFLFMSRIQLPVLFLFMCIVFFRFFKTRGLVKLGLLSMLILTIGFSALIYLVKPLNRQFLGAFEKFHPRHAYTDQANGFNERLIFWKCSVDLFKQNSLTGVGVGDLYDDLSTCYTEIKIPRMAGFNCHNQYLQILLSTGIFGFLVFAYLLTLQIVRAVKSKDTLYQSFIVVICLSFMTESIMELQRGIVFFILMGLLFYSSNIQTALAKQDN